MGFFCLVYFFFLKKNNSQYNLAVLPLLPQGEVSTFQPQPHSPSAHSYPQTTGFATHGYFAAGSVSSSVSHSGSTKVCANTTQWEKGEATVRAGFNSAVTSA